MILDLDPATRTVIQTDVGRREIPASEVVYAGSAGRDPFLVPSAPTTNVPPIAPERLAPMLPLIELRSETPSVQFFIWTGLGSYKGTGQSDHPLGVSWTTSGTANSFRPLCIAPCYTPLAEGTYRMGLARPGEQPVLLQGNVEVRRGVPLRAEYTSDQRSRALPIGIIVTGAVVTLGGAGLGLQALGEGEDATLPAILIGAGLTGMLVGALLNPAHAPDTVRIRADVAGAAAAHAAHASAQPRRPRALGPTLSGAF